MSKFKQNPKSDFILIIRDKRGIQVRFARPLNLVVMSELSFGVYKYWCTFREDEATGFKNLASGSTKQRTVQLFEGYSKDLCIF